MGLGSLFRPKTETFEEFLLYAKEKGAHVAKVYIEHHVAPVLTAAAEARLDHHQYAIELTSGRATYRHPTHNYIEKDAETFAGRDEAWELAEKDAQQLVDMLTESGITVVNEVGRGITGISMDYFRYDSEA